MRTGAEAAGAPKGGAQKEVDSLKQEKLRLEDQLNQLTINLQFRDDQINRLNR